MLYSQTAGRHPKIMKDAMIKFDQKHTPWVCCKQLVVFIVFTFYLLEIEMNLARLMVTLAPTCPNDALEYS